MTGAAASALGDRSAPGGCVFAPPRATALAQPRRGVVGAGPVIRPVNRCLVAFFRRYLADDRAAEKALTTRTPELLLLRHDLGE